MSENDLTAYELIRLGSHLLCVRNCQIYTLKQYKTEVDKLVELAAKVGFKSTVDAAKPLQEELSSLASQVGGDAKFSVERSKFGPISESIRHVMNGEADRRTLILTDAKPPAAIGRLTGLEPHQQALLDDMVTCFKAHLARPAIVMAWALGYDIVRWWVHKDPARLAAFNLQFKQGPIVNYDDFFRVGERVFLDTCKNAQGALKDFNENTHHSLVHLLNERNNYAHANFHDATIFRASAFVEKLVETITGRPFK